MQRLCRTEDKMAKIIIYIEWIFCLLYLFFCAGNDRKTKSIHPMPAVLISLAALVFNLFFKTRHPEEIVFTLLFGAVLFLISFASHSSIGSGDCFVILAAGSLTGLFYEFFSLTAGLLYSAVRSAILLILKKADRKDTFPFLPYLFFGHLTVFLLSVLL